MTNTDNEYHARIADAVQSMLNRPLDSETLTPEELALFNGDLLARAASLELSEELCRRLDELIVDYSNGNQVEAVLHDLARWVEASRRTASSNEVEKPRGSECNPKEDRTD